MKREWVITLGFAWLVVRHAVAFEITQIKIQTNGAAVTWSTEAGRSYQVESAAAVVGPWQTRAVLQANSNTLQWVDTEAIAQPQRFYRIASVTQASLRGPLLAGDAVPRDVGTVGLQSSDTGAKAAFLARQLGTGGAQLVTTGTLTEQGQNWNYAASPNDRLVVKFQSGTNVTFYITRMEGNFSGDAANFLQQPHNFDFRVVIPGVTDLTFTSEIPPATCNFRATARGALVWGNATYTVNLTLSGQYCFESGFGYYSLLNDYTSTGTVTVPGYALTVDQRRRFELIATGGDTASSEQDWNNNTLTIGADTYKWVNARKQKSFKNGKPSSLDTYWQASGGVLKNGEPYGTYQMKPDSVLGYVKFLLVLPNEVIELESWNVLL